jgi:hypothetical protein
VTRRISLATLAACVLAAAAVSAVNECIRSSRQSDAVPDFDRAVRDPQDPARILPAYDVADHLHLNPAGYGALAAAGPSRLLSTHRSSTDWRLP